MSRRKQCFGCDVYFNGEDHRNYCDRCQEEVDAIKPKLKLVNGRRHEPDTTRAETDITEGSPTPAKS